VRRPRPYGLLGWKSGFLPRIWHDSDRFSLFGLFSLFSLFDDGRDTGKPDSMSISEVDLAPERGCPLVISGWYQNHTAERFMGGLTLSKCLKDLGKMGKSGLEWG
jgi:hypothetical protein